LSVGVSFTVSVLVALSSPFALINLRPPPHIHPQWGKMKPDLQYQ
jgi:hypothetical protein